MCTTKTEGRKDNEKIKSDKSRPKKARCVNKLYAYLDWYYAWYNFVTYLGFVF